MATWNPVSVGATATFLGHAQAGGDILIQNTGSATIYVAPSSSVVASAAGGIEVTTGSTFIYRYAQQSGADAWYGIVATGSQTAQVLTP